jgi:hypothetical protein
MPDAKDNDKALREHIVYLLQDGGAHAKFDDVFTDVPTELRGKQPAGLPHSLWMLLEHMRIGQWDILEFSRNAKHKSPKWPEGYWPDSDAPPNSAAWDASVAAFRRDLVEMEKLVKDPSKDLFASIPHGQGQTLLREALLVADHNSYHVGQLILLRRLLGAWK